MREKLIDIVLQTPCVAVSSRTAAGRIVDNLIANGVTIQPQTKADRIRAMSDYELASWLAKSQITNVAEALKLVRIPWEQHPDLQELTVKDCLEWLQQPVEE